MAAIGVRIDFVGSDFLEAPELRRCPNIRFLNLRGDMRPEAPRVAKIRRVFSYYWKLLKYAATSRERIFHVLWNNRWESFDRTLLQGYYRILGKRIALTVHNVNIRKRDGNDSALNRATLAVQYRLASHMFVHTAPMKRELEEDFGVAADKISVIPFGINSTVPSTSIESAQARRLLGLRQEDKVLLFFGNIAPYKGLEFLIEAMHRLRQLGLEDARLVIAGRPKGAEEYWSMIEERIQRLGIGGMVVTRIGYVPDDETEIYFKAADVLVLPYTHVYQSGVLFLGYNFGLPVIAADIASLKDDVVVGETGYLFPPRNTEALSLSLFEYFGSELYRTLPASRAKIRHFASTRYSWAEVARITKAVYAKLGKAVAC